MCLLIISLSARLLLAPSDVGGTLSSGIYILKACAGRSTDERHYVIYWPEDSTWNDSAASSVGRNRVTFMRYKYHSLTYYSHT